MKIKQTVKVELTYDENEAYNTFCDWLFEIMNSPEATEDIKRAANKVWNELLDLDKFLIGEG